MSVELFLDKHLFVDEHRIETLTAAKRVLNQPHKRPQPVMRADRPWEQGRGIYRGKVLYDRQRQRFRLWYTAQAAIVLGTGVLVRDNPPSKVHETGQRSRDLARTHCEPIIKDALDASVRRRGSSTVRSLSGKRGA